MKVLHLTFIGKTNAGKSSLLNTLKRQGINIVSPAPQSTRDVIEIIITTDDYQLIIADTPGYHQVRQSTSNQLNMLLYNRMSQAIQTAEYLVYLSAIDEKMDDNDAQLAAIMPPHIPRLAIITKVDLVSDPRQLSERVMALRALGFTNILSTSIYKEVYIQDLIKELLKHAVEGMALYPSNIDHNRSDDFIIREHVRSAIYQYTYQELPYSSAVVVTESEVDKERLYASVIIFVQRSSQVGMLIGRLGENITNIKRRAIKSLSLLYKRQVVIDIKVKLSKNWTKDMQLVRRYH